MPIYEYAPVEAPGCALCCYGFEHRQRMDDPALEQCPACGGGVRRTLCAVPVHTGRSHLLAEGHLARHGFSQYRRVERGLYERSAGSEGPEVIDARPREPESD